MRDMQDSLMVIVMVIGLFIAMVAMSRSANVDRMAQACESQKYFVHENIVYYCYPYRELVTGEN